jgi:hypothetical protein
MRLHQIQNKYLYEGLDRSASSTMLLWENAGVQLREAALTADQIQQIFAAVEKGATDSGSNRTMLGKGKDAASAVNTAWEDLKTKVQNSGPIKAVDQKFDDVVAKIEAGLGGPNNKVNQVIQQYRKFAKERPISQSLIYAALIAAAGISGAGLGGAAVLGLLKMTDKLLQGEKFSSAAYSGAKTGALAYGASKLGDLIKGKPEGGGVSGDIEKGLAADQAFQDRILNKFPPDQGYTFDSSGKSLQVFDSTGRKVFTGDIPLKTMDMKTFADLTNNGQMATPGISSGSISSDVAAGVSDKAASVVSSGADVVSNIGDKSAKYAWQLVQQKIDSGELTDPKALSSELNKALSKAFSDYGINPNSPDAEASKKIAKDVIMKSKDLETLYSTLSGTDAASTPSASTTPTTQVSSGFKIAGEPVIPGEPLSKKQMSIMKMSMNMGNTYPPEIMSQYNSQLPKGESVVYQTRPLSEGQVYLVFNRICQTNNQMIAEGKLAEGPLDALKGFAAKGLEKAKTVGKNLTTKVTADKLNSAWQAVGSPMDSTEVAQLLADQGVDSGVVDKVFKDLKISAAAPAAKSASGVSYAEVKKLVMTLPKKEKQRMIQYITKQLGTA